MTPLIRPEEIEETLHLLIPYKEGIPSSEDIHGGKKNYFSAERKDDGKLHSSYKYFNEYNLAAQWADIMRAGAKVKILGYMKHPYSIVIDENRQEGSLLFALVQVISD